MGIMLRPATMADVPLLEKWNAAPHLIPAVHDDPNRKIAFDVGSWADEIAAQSDVFQYFIAEAGGQPIGALSIIDPASEPSRYWGDVEPGLRAVDIWIGEVDALGRGHGTAAMRLALAYCFSDPAVTAVLIDPLASNVRAHRFYQRLGFSAVERRMFDETDDCLVHILTRQDWRASLLETRS